MTRTFKRLVAVLALAAIPLGPGIVAAPVGATGLDMGHCFIAQIPAFPPHTGVHSGCGDSYPSYSAIQTWLQCSLDRTWWLKGNIVTTSHNSMTEAINYSTVYCPSGRSPVRWTMAYWL